MSAEIIPLSQPSAFRRLWDLGYRQLVPIVPPNAELSPKSGLYKRLKAGRDARGKCPGMRWADGTWSGMDWLSVEATEADLERWAAWGAGVGLKLGGEPGIFALDADTLDPKLARIIERIITERLGLLPCRIGRAPKALFLCRVSEQLPYMKIEFGKGPDGKPERLEVLGFGRQCVMDGDHPVTLKPYTLARDLPLYDRLPVVTAAQIVDVLGALRSELPTPSAVITEGSGAKGPAPDQDSLVGDLETVRRAVELIPNTTAQFPTRNDYLRMGYAIKAALPDHPSEALGLWEDWAMRWDDLDEEDPRSVIEADWGRMHPPFHVGAGFLCELAAKAAPESFSGGEQWFEPVEGGEAPLSPGSIQKPLKEPKLKFLTFAEAVGLASAETAAPLIKGLLDQGAMTVLYGESNAGKTFVAMDMAHAIATGRLWGGMKVARLTVAYIAAEGGRGALKRLAALERKYGAGADFFVLPASVDLLHREADLGPLIAAVGSLPGPVGLIVLDTLSRAMAGGDENASTDMGNMVRHLDVLRSATKAHVLTVHHSGKDRAKGARGHSLLRAATDTEIEVADGQIVVTKQRDLEKSWSSAFELEPVELWKDGDGDPVTSATLRLIPPRESAVVELPMSPREQEVYEAIGAIRDISEAPGAGVSTAELVAYMRDTGVGKATVSTCLARLKLKKRIKSAGDGGKWLRVSSGFKVNSDVFD